MLRSGEGKVTQAVAMRARLLNGVGLITPRKSTSPNIWARDNPEVVTKLLAQDQVATKGDQDQTTAAGSSTTEAEKTVENLEEKGAPKRNRNNLAHRNQLITAGFNALPMGERTRWELKATTELQDAKAEYERIVTKPPSDAPKDRQR